MGNKNIDNIWITSDAIYWNSNWWGEDIEKLKKDLEQLFDDSKGKDWTSGKIYFPLKSSITKIENEKESAKKLNEILVRIGNAEKDLQDTKNEAKEIKNQVRDDKKDVERIEGAMTEKFKLNFSISTAVLVAVALAIIWLVWQSFWLYPNIYRDYVTITEIQNNKIDDQEKEINQLNKNITELKFRLEKEVDRRLILEARNTNK